jgi:hypothetical protein
MAENIEDATNPVVDPEHVIPPPCPICGRDDCKCVEAAHQFEQDADGLTGEAYDDMPNNSGADAE